MTKLEKLRRDVPVLNYKVVNMYWSVRTFPLSTLRLYLLHHLIDNFPGIRGVFAMCASPNEQFNTSVKAAYRQTAKRSATHIDEVLLDLNQL